MSKVLVVDDDLTVAGVVVGYLERAGHRALHVANGRKALEAVSADRPDLLVLDLMLPEIDGLEVCRRVRAEHPDLPIIMLTALGEADERIAGLEVGADDYVTKPFSPRELILRIESVLRRAGDAPAPRRELTAGPITPRHGRADRSAQRSGTRADHPRVRPARVPDGPPGAGVQPR